MANHKHANQRQDLKRFVLFHMEVKEKFSRCRYHTLQPKHRVGTFQTEQICLFSEQKFGDLPRQIFGIKIRKQK